MTRAHIISKLATEQLANLIGELTQKNEGESVGKVLTDEVFWAKVKEESETTVVGTRPTSECPIQTLPAQARK